MGKLQTKGQLKKTFALSIAAQFISLCVSFVIGFVLPKQLPEYQYAYWQTFVMYSGYAGILQFGILDGIVLRYSQYDYDELPKDVMSSQFQLLMGWLTGISLVLYIIVSKLFFNESSGIMICVCLSIITKHLFAFASYSYQITNRIKHYAVLVIVQRMVYAVMVIILLVFKIEGFVLYCIAELVGDLISFVISIKDNYEIYFSKMRSFAQATREALINISSGIILMVANWASMLFVGAAKMIIQWRWGMLLFGKISFAFSITNLFLAFVNALSVVLFPTLKRMNSDSLSGVYVEIRKAMSIFLFVIMAAYFPGCMILRIWIPKYADSLPYLGVLLPIIIYSSKVGMLTNNYLKAYREEKRMLLVNAVSITVGIVGYILTAYVFDSLTALLIMVNAAILMRSVLSEVIVMQIIRQSFYKDFIVEFLMTVGFIFSASLLNNIFGFVLYVCMLMVYLFVYKDSVSKLIISFVGKK